MAMRSLGHDAVTIPLYLPPLMDDTTTDSEIPVFFGGVNVYLQQQLSLFRHTPRWIDKFFDSQSMLKYAAKKAGMTKTSGLGSTTISMLKGDAGRQVKELKRLVDFLANDIRPEIIVLSNALLLGMAGMLKEELGCKIACLLQDEEEFVDTLGPEHTPTAWNLIREAAGDVDVFIAGSRYYAQTMQKKLSVDSIEVAYNGIDRDYTPAAAPPSPPTIGFLGHICHARGIDQLIESFIRIKSKPELKDTRLIVIGGSVAEDHDEIQTLKHKLVESSCSDDVEWAEDFDRSDKSRLLPQMNIMCVPDRMPPASAICTIESLLAGVPFLAPDSGVYPELIEMTQGGVSFISQDPDDLDKKLSQLLTSPESTREMGIMGRQVAVDKLSAKAAAKRLLDILLAETPEAQTKIE